MTATIPVHAHAAARRSRLVLAAVTLLLGACGQTPVPSGPGPVGTPGPTAMVSAAVPASPGRSLPVAGASSSAPPSGPTVLLPAGVQYPDPAMPSMWSLPSTSTWNVADAGFRTTKDGQVTAVLGSRGDQQTRLAVRDASGGWADRLVDAGVGVRGPGVYTATDWILPNGIAAGPAGYLVFGQAGIADPSHHAISRLGFTWISSDGAAWTRTDLRGVLGADAAFVPRSAIATSSGWLLAGSLSSRNLQAKAEVVVLSSPDGTHWRQVGRISSGWSLTAGSLDTLAGTTVLSGSEWVCDTSGSMLNAAIGSPVLRLWSSPDGGTTWTARDSTAGGVVTPRAPAPASAAECTGGDYAYATVGTYFGVIQGRAVAVSADHARIATSADLSSWQTADLAGAVPVGGSSYQPSAASSLLAVPDGSGLALLSLESRRDDRGAVATFGSQVFAWTSADGITWGSMLAGPPLELTANGRLIASPDGSVYLMDHLLNTAVCGGDGCKTDTGPLSYRRSTAGPPVSAPPCAPGPTANCAFATLDTSLAGADLSRIDLYGAVLAGKADLSGANLSGARLTGLTVATGASLAGANLSGADLESATFGAGAHLAAANFAKASLAKASFYTNDTAGASFAGADLSATNLDPVDLSGVSLAGATMTGSYVNQSIFSANLAGVHLTKPLVTVGPGPAGLVNHDFGTADLSGWLFGGPGSSLIGNLSGADFRHANVAGLTLTNVDLTGAHFPPGAKSQIDFNGGLQIYFGAGVTCPDGKPGTKVSFAYDCRLGG